jgi:hypothetical protein
VEIQHGTQRQRTRIPPESVCVHTTQAIQYQNHSAINRRAHHLNFLFKKRDGFAADKIRIQNENANFRVFFTNKQRKLA